MIVKAIDDGEAIEPFDRIIAPSREVDASSRAECDTVPTTLFVLIDYLLAKKGLIFIQIKF